MYETGEIPNDFSINKTVTILKKVEADKCENCLTISLTPHLTKISLVLGKKGGLEKHYSHYG